MLKAIAALMLMTSMAHAGPLFNIPAGGSALEGVQERLDKPNTVLVINNRGGEIHGFYNQMMKWEKHGTHVEIKGMCYSACTLYSGLNNVCIHDGAFMEFHRASPILRYSKRLDEVVEVLHSDEAATNWILDTIAPSFKKYIKAHISKLPTYDKGTFLVILADTIIKNGWMKRCDPLPSTFHQFMNSGVKFFSGQDDYHGTRVSEVND